MSFRMRRGRASFSLSSRGPRASYRLGCAIPAVVVAIVLATIVAACRGPATIQQQTTRVPTSPSAPTTQVGAALVAVMEMKDKKGDLDDGEGGSAVRAPHVDIVKVRAAADGEDLRLILSFAGDVPKRLSSFDQEITYAIDIETNRSGETDYSVLIGNLEGRRWYAQLTEWREGGITLDLTPTVDGIVGVVVSLDRLGSPTSIRLSVIAQRADHADGTVLAEDRLPNNAGSMQPTSKWLTLGG